MKKIKTLLILAFSTLLLAGCGTPESSSTPSVDSSESSSSIEEDSSSLLGEDWNEKAKTLLKKYCGETLPYPRGFSGEVTIDEIIDEEDGSSYLQIYNPSKELSISDYYLDLEKIGWTCIRDYSGEAAQKTSNGTEYFELTSISKDKKIGYDITYFYNDTYKVSVIQCYNDKNVSLDTKTSWSELEENLFLDTLTISPSKLKTGDDFEVYATSEDDVTIHDTYYEDLSEENVAMLEKDGWVLDAKMSKENNSFVLSKKSTYGTPVYVSLYYFSGNYINFSYYYDVYQSNSWPNEFVSSFESSTGFDIPQIDGDTYYYYTKKGAQYIYVYSDDSYIASDYEDTLRESNAIFDNEKRWFTDWEENWYLKDEMTLETNTYESIFRISFSTLEEPYDDILTSYPSDKISSFMSNNNMEGIEVPSFDLTSYGSLRVSVNDYSDAYKEAYKEVSSDPEYYNIEDPTNEEEIKAVVEGIAKENTKVTIKIRDTKSNKAYEYLKSSFKMMGWAYVSTFTYDVAYEDATGKALLGLTKSNGITTISITYGSGKAHTPAFYFLTPNVSLNSDSTYDLDLRCDLLKGEVRYSSDNEKFKVDSNGHVTLSEDVMDGDSARISARILAEGEEVERVATCTITVTDNYDYEKAINASANLYNTYFNLSENDEGYAIPSKKSEELYEFSVYPSSIKNLDEAKTLILEHLIPNGFMDNCDGEWTEDESSASIDYVFFNEEGFDDIQMTFEAFLKSDNTLGIKVSAYKF